MNMPISEIDNVASYVPPREARERIAVAAGAALLIAGLVLVAFVLPAEYAVDPIGTGARFRKKLLQPR